MGGMRYFETDRNQVSEILTPFLNSEIIQGASAGPDPLTVSSESDVLFKGQGTFRPTEDHQIYVQVAQGYRASGVNSQTVSQIPADYESDQTLNLEGGIKTNWLDGRILANLSVYTIDWDNIQFQMPYTQQFNGLVNCYNVSDAVTAEGYEIDLAAQATENLDVGFNFTSMDAKWNVDANDCLSAADLAATFDDSGNGTGDGTGILAGDSMIGVPDHSGSAYAQYNFSNGLFGSDSAFIRADIMFQGTVPTNDDDPAINQANPSYELVNINGGIDFGRYSINVFVRNVFDEEAHLSLFQGFQQDNRVTPSNPRTFGASFTYNFGD